MTKIWTILKALWTFWQANGELIEKHVLWLKAELAERNLQRAAKAVDDAKAAVIDANNEPMSTSSTTSTLSTSSTSMDK